MKTAIETKADGTKLRVYHRAGSTAQGPDTRYSWTHSMSERKSCVACVKGTIPEDIKDSTRGAES